jgi:hypothetical protein
MAQHDDPPSLSEMLTTVGCDGLQELLRDLVVTEVSALLCECGA